MTDDIYTVDATIALRITDPIALLTLDLVDQGDGHEILPMNDDARLFKAIWEALNSKPMRAELTRLGVAVVGGKVSIGENAQGMISPGEGMDFR